MAVPVTYCFLLGISDRRSVVDKLIQYCEIFKL